MKKESTITKFMEKYQAPKTDVIKTAHIMNFMEKYANTQTSVAAARAKAITPVSTTRAVSSVPTSTLSKFIDSKTAVTKGRNDVSEFTLMIDGTGSMDGVFEACKAASEELVNTIFTLKEGIKIGILLYDYSDVCSSFQPSSDKESILGFIKSMSCSYPGVSIQSYYEAMEAALLQFCRSESNFGIVIGDAGPTEGAYAEVFEELVSSGKTLNTVGVIGAGVRCFNRLKDLMTPLCLKTGGSFYTLENLNELIAIISVMFAKKTNKVNDLKKMWENTGGGKITAVQQKVLRLTM